MSDKASAKKRLLLIGSSGRVGGLLLKQWRRDPPEGFEVIAQRRSQDGAVDRNTVIWDLTGSPPAILCNSQVETTVVALAGTTPASEAPLERNSEIALSCIRAARMIGAVRILFSSSSAVYGPGSGEPMSEGHIPDQQNAYGNAKLAMEAAIRGAVGDIDYSILRIGNVLGADALSTAARKLALGEDLYIDQFESGGGPVRSYIDPGVFASVLVSLATYSGRLPKVLNVACPVPTSMQALAEALGLPWRWRPAPASAHENIVLNCSLLKEIHAFEPADCNPHQMISRLETLGIHL